MDAENITSHEQMAALDFELWELENSDEELRDRRRQRLNALSLTLPIVFCVLRRSKPELIKHLRSDKLDELGAVVCETFRENAKAAKWLLMLIEQAEARMMVALHNLHPDSDIYPDQEDEDEDDDEDDDEDEDDDDDDDEDDDEDDAA
jgi:hypothetical protein